MNSIVPHKFQKINAKDKMFSVSFHAGSFFSRWGGASAEEAAPSFQSVRNPSGWSQFL